MNDENKNKVKICNDILRDFKRLGKSKDRPDIFLLVDELKSKVAWLKTLYKQIID